MKVNLSSLSQRAQALISAPRFYLEGESRELDFAIENVGDKILTARHRGPRDEMSFLFAEVLSQFSEGKTLREIWRISFREIESFLRDENHLPFSPEDALKLENLFVKVKLSLMGALFRVVHALDFSEVSKASSRWSELSLVEKNKSSQVLFSALSWDFIYCDGEVSYVRGVFEGLSTEAMEAFLGEIFRGAGKVLPMKVVAV
nr:hypothetical protein BHI3_21670 [Bacteriovorax sp. HI3]